MWWVAIAASAPPSPSAPDAALCQIIYVMDYPGDQRVPFGASLLEGHMRTSRVAVASNRTTTHIDLAHQERANVAPATCLTSARCHPMMGMRPAMPATM